MRNAPNLRVEEYRLRDHPLLGTTTNDGNNGVFQIPRVGCTLNIVVGDGWCEGPGKDWDHVSVTVCGQKRCPTWEEMKFVKELFFRDDETVLQIHPPTDKNVSLHPYCLHLWRHHTLVIPLPDPRTIA